MIKMKQKLMCLLLLSSKYFPIEFNVDSTKSLSDIYDDEKNAFGIMCTIDTFLKERRAVYIQH